ncbi:MAG: hypothetical protein KC964_28985, partial [Candidatus Omnitrophica bacterium]|nr:hypothetical protein [Candidatus Omnitrophota bacterium]
MTIRKNATTYVTIDLTEDWSGCYDWNTVLDIHDGGGNVIGTETWNGYDELLVTFDVTLQKVLPNGSGSATVGDVSLPTISKSISGPVPANWYTTFPMEHGGGVATSEGTQFEAPITGGEVGSGQGVVFFNNYRDTNGADYFDNDKAGLPLEKYVRLSSMDSDFIKFFDGGKYSAFIRKNPGDSDQYLWADGTLAATVESSVLYWNLNGYQYKFDMPTGSNTEFVDTITDASDTSKYLTYTYTTGDRIDYIQGTNIPGLSGTDKIDL